MTSKPFYLSKTFWAAVVYAVVALAKAFGIEGADAGQWDQVIEIGAGAVAMLALRAVTTQPIHFISPDK